MTDETGNPVPDLLRGRRADREQRFEAVETRFEGRRHAFVGATGSLVTDTKGHDARTIALEGARV